MKIMYCLKEIKQLHYFKDEIYILLIYQQAMHLVDCYDTIQTVNFIKQGWSDPLSSSTQELSESVSRASIYFQELVKTIKSKYQKNTIVIDENAIQSQNLLFLWNTTTSSISLQSIPKNKNLYDASILIYGSHLYQNKYRSLLQVTLNELKQSIQIQVFFVCNGLPLRFKGEQDILMALRKASSISRIIAPHKIKIDPITGDCAIGTMCFIDIQFERLFKFSKFVDQCNVGVRKLQRLVETIQTVKVVLLWVHGINTNLQEEKMVTQTVKKIKKDIMNRQRQLKRLEQTLFLFPINPYQKESARINSYIKEKRMNETYQHFTQDVLRILTCFIDRPDKVQYQKHNFLKELSKGSYTQEQLQEMTTLIDSRLQFNIYTNIYINNYQFLKWEQVGSGGFGMVEMTEAKIQILDHPKQSVISQQQEAYEEYDIYHVTSKITRKQDKKNNLYKIIREKQLMSTFKGQKHPNLVSLLNFINDFSGQDSDRFLFSVYEQNDSLDRYLCRIKEVCLFKRLQMLCQAAKGLLFLHQKGVLHLDFKPGNLLVGSKYIVKICDFGESQFQHQKKNNRGRTILYAPPELYIKNKAPIKDTDVYSLGASIYWCIFGQHIWGTVIDYSAFENEIRTGKAFPRLLPEFFEYSSMSRVLKILVNLCLRCLQWQQKNIRRPSLREVITILDFCANYVRESSL